MDTEDLMTEIINQASKAAKIQNQLHMKYVLADDSDLSNFKKDAKDFMYWRGIGVQ